ncbi:slipin family protein [Candidatus Competibacter phosphatis]|jgi:regulator of protease activity HflC (stomatin/prohibitin superfamily)|uniref:Slipin family protein n=1 Tax=Candidatus Competibacter phosphatis TaxID=221280 RepID=A0ABX1TJE8_9GAMM|nr:slipin family protein [Candidatus Competibacter phosphatis]MDG4560356.1 slipin family protein [Candidatus Competibacter sp.]NMQ18239.1 slipin family protein [Candidatus Competibacter phosphatis]
MLGFQRIVIAQNERGLHLYDRRLAAILEPGVYRWFDPLRRHEVQRYDLSVAEFDHPWLDVLLRTEPALVARHFQVVETGEHQVGLIYKNGRLAGVLPPATRQAYWRGPVEVKVELLDIGSDYALSRAHAALLARPSATLAKTLNGFTLAAEVEDQHIGLLLVDGELVRTLPPGLHAFWRFNRSVKVETVDLRLQTVEVSGQEILTKDKVSLRVNLSAVYRIADPVKARGDLGNIAEYLYRTLQFGLRQAIGTQPLDGLLGDKDQLDRVVRNYVAERVEPHGLALETVGIKDVILPGEMKDILNQVVTAEKAAQANVIRRREEVAATRSLLNTAKLMEENPILLRLKELEALEKVVDKVERLTVFGGLDGVLRDTVRIDLPTH